MASTSTYPEGNRFATTDADSRQAEIWIISLLSLMYSLIILSGRVVVKWNFHGLDDIAVGFAYVRSLDTVLFRFVELTRTSVWHWGIGLVCMSRYTLVLVRQLHSSVAEV